MLFRVEVDHNAIWQARITAPGVAGWAEIVRAGDLDAGGFPLPPQAETIAPDDPALPLTLPGAETMRVAARDRFAQQEPRGGERDVEALGGYLFHVLLGSDWAAIVANVQDSEPIQLQLLLPVDGLWEQLPWELMMGPQGPLVQRAGTVSIARVVGPVTKERALTIDIPLRVLFVMGREIDNQLRPVTEYVSVLRQLQATIGNEAGGIGVTLHARLLQDATTDEVEAAVREFKPSVVHVIAHGQISDGESVVLLTRYEGSLRTNPRTDPIAADRFAQSVGASDETIRPHAVILNACNTARNGDVPVSFAAKLVRLGIPVAVGMAGEVADTACRLFTRQFYSALVEQHPVDVAAAKGRRAALLHFRNFKETFDWGRAVFCQAGDITTKFDVGHVQQSLITAAGRLRPKQQREPFCGRLSWMPLFRDVFSGTTSNLAIPSTEDMSDDEKRPQLGKSRLLEEVMWHSVLEGWIPVLIDKRRFRSPFSNLMDFAVNLFTLLEDTRETFGCKRVFDSTVVRIACDRWGVPYAGGEEFAFMAARDAVLKQLKPQQDITEKLPFDTVRQCLRADIERLRTDVQARAGTRKGVLLLWDDLDRQEAIGDECVRSVTEWGFGSEACPAPLVFTYASRSLNGRKLLDEIKENSHIATEQLSRYEPLETKTACRQFLAWKKFIPSRTKRDSFDLSLGALESEVDGYPSNLFGLGQGLRILEKQQVLIVCDDVDIVAQYP